MTNIEYEKRICAFIDILGFKELVEGKNKKSANEIHRLFSRIQNNYSKRFDFEINKTPSNVNFTHFSDTIVLSSNQIDAYNFEGILLAIILMQISLILDEGALLRGACSLNDLFHSENALFGKALNDAYDLETKSAIYPRIILPKDLIDELFGSENSMQFHRILNAGYLTKDNDGHWYIDYIMVRPELFSQRIIYAEYSNKIEELIDTHINSSSESIKQKYQWLQEKYSKALARYQKGNFS